MWSSPLVPRRVSASSVPRMRLSDAAGSTVTVRGAVVVAASPSDSVAVDATVSSMAPVKPSGGVRVRPESSLTVHDPSPLSVPDESVAPSGTPETITDRLSEPSVSVRAEAMESGMAVPSSPSASETARLGASATPDIARLTTAVS